MGVQTIDHSLAPRPRAQRRRHRQATAEPLFARLLLTGTAVLFLFLFLVLPAVAVLVEAFSEGISGWIRAVAEGETRNAVKLTLIAAGIAVPANMIFGLAAAWAVTKFRFRGKGLLLTLIDLPFAVSPVIGGMAFVLLFGVNGLVGPWLEAHGIKVIFAIPGIVLATTFVTFPFVARELIPFMQALGTTREEAAATLGAGGWQTFRRVTLPSVKWGLLYGVILCNARAMGEFGAVSVVSGHIRGQTNTLPLHVEILYNEYSFAAAFAVASLLLLLALATLLLKRLLEWKIRRQLQHGTEA